MKRIKFGELEIGETAQRHIQDCLDTNWISMGPKTQLLEEKFAKLMDCKHGIALSSGTTALTAMTLALPEIANKEVVWGKSKVICPALAFIANTTGILSGGLVPKWVDIQPETLNINPYMVEEAIDKDVVAIYAVGTMGLPANMRVLSQIAQDNDLILFHDACEDYGSRIGDRFSHKYAIGGCSSMFQAHLVQAGEGSVLFTDDSKLDTLIRSIRSHGRNPDSDYFDHVRFGSNFKTTDLCSSIALEGVEQFHQNIKERKRVWSILVDFVYSRGYDRMAWFSHEPDGVEVMPHGFSITVKPQNHMTSKGYLKVHHLVEAFDKYNIQWKRNFGFCGDHANLDRYVDPIRKVDNARWCGEHGVHIGTHRYISDNDIERIMTALKECFE